VSKSVNNEPKKAPLEKLWETSNEDKSFADENIVYIHEQVHLTVSSLLERFDDINKKRGRGTPSHQDQDLLRGMILFAASGLDAFLKETFRSFFPKFLNAQFERSVAAFKKYLADVTQNSELNTEITYALITAQKPKELIVERYIDGVVRDSMQSRNQLMKAITALDIEDKVFLKAIDAKEIDDFFHQRNLIVHEFDIDITKSRGKNSKKRSRKREDAIRLVNASLKIQTFILTALSTRASTLV
jgi:hypothetical protein